MAKVDTCTPEIETPDIASTTASEVGILCSCPYVECLISGR